MKQGLVIMDKTKNYRNKIYKEYSSRRIGTLAPDTVGGFKPRAPYFEKVIRDHFPQDKTSRILEIGCGHGAFLYFLQRSGYTDIDGVDTSEEQVREAHRLGITCVRHGNLMEVLAGIKDNSLDVLIAFDVIEHFTKDELSDLVDEFYRILKRGGKVISHQPNAEGPFGNFMRHWDFTHELAFTRQSIAQLFFSSGFAKVQSYEDKPVMHGMKSLARYILWEFVLRRIYMFRMVIETGGCDHNSIFSLNFLTIAEK